MLSVSQIRVIGNGHYENHQSNRELMRLAGVASPATVSRVIHDINNTGMAWSELKAMDDAELMQYVRPGSGRNFVPVPYDRFYESMSGSRKLSLTWCYEKLYLALDRKEGTEFYSYQRVSALYAKWLKESRGVKSLAGIPAGVAQYCEIDYSGDPLYYLAPDEKLHKTQVFVAVLRYSGMLYAEAMPDQRARSWLLGLRHAFEYFGGVTRYVAVDNARALVLMPDRHAGGITVALKAFARHYCTGVHTSRVRSPRDKDRAEFGAGEFQSKIQAVIARGGYVEAGSIEELNTVIRERLDEYNRRPFTDSKRGSRLSVFTEFEKGKLMPLPAVPFENYQWSLIMADRYHRVKVRGHRFMVAPSMALKQVAVGVGLSEIIFLSHPGATEVGRYSAACLNDQVNTTHDDRRYMKEGEIAMRLTEDEAAAWFTEQGYGTECVLAFVREIYRHYTNGDDDLARYRARLSFYGLIKHYGISLTEEVCSQLGQQGLLSWRNVSLLKERLRLKAGEINRARACKKRRKAGTPATDGGNDGSASSSFVYIY